MQIIAGTFNGTGAAVYICPGFIPDEVFIVNLEDAIYGAHIMWSSQYRAADGDNGILIEADGTAQVALTAGTGIEPYEGGDLMTSSNQTSTGYGEGVYLVWDDVDYAKSDAYGYDATAITTWTLDTSANRTGHFNEDTPATVSRIGEGSEIWIKEDSTGLVKKTMVEAVTAGAGEATDEVTLARSIGSGQILRIGGMYSMIPLGIGYTTPAGFKLNLTALVNDNDEIQYFKAIAYDN